MSVYSISTCNGQSILEIILKICNKDYKGRQYCAEQHEDFSINLFYLLF